MNSPITAVIVTFHPELTKLSALLTSLIPQVDHIVLVDNTPGGASSLQQYEDGRTVHLLELGWNSGIAHALNAGIRKAGALNSRAVLLSDQDSLPADDMVARLMECANTAQKRGLRVGAVGPTYQDNHTQIQYPFQVQRPGHLFYCHQIPGPSDQFVETNLLITSGTLIPMPVFDTVGDMREDLFIDQVDVEWCHRARHAGFSLLGSKDATMGHNMGDDAIRVWAGKWRRETRYPPIRMYYRIRNFVTLCGYKTIPLRWKVRSAWYWLGFVYAQTFFGNQRLSSLMMAIKGFGDGFRSHLGPYSRDS